MIDAEIHKRKEENLAELQPAWPTEKFNGFFKKNEYTKPTSQMKDRNLMVKMGVDQLFFKFEFLWWWGQSSEFCQTFLFQSLIFSNGDKS